ncbi:hypothetical protein ABG82_24250 [Mycobacteroides immunogenum]|uniref:Uncharacterized protein n=1 Tax=Mycobacteroides immunogenum TaxID=83262 RepID=A0A7V8LNY3_9MYCO|nr:hypothetical protein ABG82_24250 [Mycobacteroides immunogenum]KIU41385.1 hypothetical protein TL11_07590 [Mycobacteroides immunogenum]KPG07937.1 hypothetical protein AN909_16450 [Mycobacteroides immunogenum]KPG09424.1 hypothetical protein AN910_16340 [Mycobacteroides immunogenum]KPG10419.1 hypothetical protein AN908_13770 [Mycobacteroides immunogenum]
MEGSAVVGTVVDGSETGPPVGVVLCTEGVVVNGVLSRTTRLSVDSTMVMSTATMAMIAAMVPTIAGPVRYQGVGFSLSSIISEK